MDPQYLTTRVRVGFAALGIAALVSACSDTVSGPSELVTMEATDVAAPAFGPVDSRSTAGVSSPDSLHQTRATPSLTLTLDEDTAEQFNCRNVETTRVRFGTPGYAAGREVGLYVYFTGLAPGAKRIRVWWDYEARGDRHQDFRPGELGADEGDSVLEAVLEHRYDNVFGTQEKLVRVELIQDGLTGNCSRNRRVTVKGPNKSGPKGVTIVHLGPSDPTVFGAGVPNTNYTNGLKFTVQRNLTLTSVRLFPAGTGALNVQLKDGSGATLLNIPRTISAPGDQRVVLGLDLTPGTYTICLNGTAFTVLPESNFGGAAGSYPFTIPNVLSITDTAPPFLGTFGGFYNFFYDWEVAY